MLKIHNRRNSSGIYKELAFKRPVSVHPHIGGFCYSVFVFLLIQAESSAKHRKR